MKVSKSRFLDYIRCPRFSALDDIKFNKEQAFIQLDQEEYLSDKYKDFLDKMIKAFVDDEEEVEITQVDILMPYFNKLELIAASLLEKRFQKPVVASLNTFEQQSFSIEYEDYQFYCYVDIYQDMGDYANICEVKAKSSTGLWNIGVKSNPELSKERDAFSIFKKAEDGIIYLKDELPNAYTELLTEKQFKNHKDKLLNPLHDFGRVVWDLAFQRFVIENQTKNYNNKYYLAIVNRNYVFDGDDESYPTKDGDEIVEYVDLTKLTKDLQEKIRINIDKVVGYLNQGNASRCNVGKHCLRNTIRQCSHYDTCYSHLPKQHNVLHYTFNSNGFVDLSTVQKSKELQHLEDRLEVNDLINNDIVRMIDIEDRYLNRINNQIQKNAVVTNDPYIDKKKITAGLKFLNYPIYHLDFESFPTPLPRFKGERAYDQSVFQFSIHIESAPGVCDFDKDHIEFLASDFTDQREEMIVKMLETIDLSNGGTVLVYNQGFEKTRIKEFAIMFPQYKEALYKLNEHVFDLMYLLKSSQSFYESLGFEKEYAKMYNYYHPNMDGSYSIKAILPLFTSLSYKDLEVQNGVMAMITYANYNNFSEVELEQNRKALIAYCKQDTWAMVEILRGLRKLVDYNG